MRPAVVQRQLAKLVWGNLRDLLRTDADALTVVAVAPLLMFPTPFRVVIALVLLVGVAFGRARSGAAPLWSRTPFDAALVLLAVMVVVAIVMSLHPDVSFPKACGVLLGLATFRAIVLAARDERRVWLLTGVYVFTGIALIMPGVMATVWSNKLPLIATITSHIPRTISGLPGTDGAVNPNALAGATLFLLPMLAVLTALWYSGLRVGFSGKPTRWFGLLLAAALAIVAVVLGLTQSRTAWVALTMTLMLLAASASRRMRWAIVIVAIMGCVAVIIVGPASVAERLWTTTGASAAGNGFGLSLADRAELWSRAVSGVRDFPLTGMGLNGFRRLVPSLYPLFAQPVGTQPAHAHNVFLQTALDVGLPGLVAYLSVLIIASFLSWRMYRTRPASTGILALGLWGNLLAVHLFGLTDAIALGAKVGLFFWYDLGLIAALYQLPEPAVGSTDTV